MAIVIPWLLYKMVTQNMLRTHEGKYVHSEEKMKALWYGGTVNLNGCNCIATTCSVYIRGRIVYSLHCTYINW